MKARKKYVMDRVEEIDRLEKQATLPAYDVHKEFDTLPANPGKLILDAGCGTGILTRHLARLYPGSRIEGCDFSKDRLEHAAKLSSGIRYFEADLEKLDAPDDTYDLVASRYVFEHLTAPAKVAQEFFRVTRPGGLVRVVDLDGVLLNLYPLSAELSGMFELLKTLPVDLFVGRRLPHLIASAGFEEIRWTVDVHAFQDEELEAERENIANRLIAAAPALTKLFGSELDYRRFEKLFLKELKGPNVVLFFNKFTVDGRKPRRGA